jgi:hypothetical protein
LLVDRLDRVIKMNDYAIRIIKERDGLSIQGNRLVCDDWTTTQEVRRELQQLLPPRAGAETPGEVRIRVLSPSDNLPVSLVVAPDVTANYGYTGKRVAILIVERLGPRRPRQPATAWRSLKPVLRIGRGGQRDSGCMWP